MPKRFGTFWVLSSHMAAATQFYGDFPPELPIGACGYAQMSSMTISSVLLGSSISTISAEHALELLDKRKALYEKAQFKPAEEDQGPIVEYPPLEATSTPLEIEELRAKVATLDGKLKTKRAEIQTLKTQVSRLERDLRFAVPYDVHSLEKRLARFESREKSIIRVKSFAEISSAITQTLERSQENPNINLKTRLHLEFFEHEARTRHPQDTFEPLGDEVVTRRAVSLELRGDEGARILEVITRAGNAAALINIIGSSEKRTVLGPPPSEWMPKILGPSSSHQGWDYNEPLNANDLDKPTFIKTNLDYEIKFKPTHFGESIYKDTGRGELEMDSLGYATMQIVDFMKVFGSHYGSPFRDNNPTYVGIAFEVRRQ